MKRSGLAIALLLLAGFALPLAFLAPPAHAAVPTTSITKVPVGGGPEGVAYDSAKGEIFVANNFGDTVTVLSDASNKVVATVSVPNGAGAGVVYDSGKGEIFVTNTGAGTVTVISDSTTPPGVGAAVAVGSQPEGMAYDSSKGEVFVANSASNTVTVLSDATEPPTVVATVPVGSEPQGVAYDSAKGEVFVSNYNSRSVSVISDANNTVIATVSVGGGPEGVAYDSAKGEVFVVNNFDATVSVISDATNPPSVVGSSVHVELIPIGIAVDSGSEVLVVNSAANTVSLISETNDSVIATVPVGVGPEYATYDSAKSEFFVTGYSDNNVAIIPAAITGHGQTGKGIASELPWGSLAGAALIAVVVLAVFVYVESRD